MNSARLTVPLLCVMLLSASGMPSAQAVSPIQANLQDGILSQEDVSIERAAVDIHGRIVQARADINHNNPDGAWRELDAAETLIGTMKESLSTAIPRGLIGIAMKHLEFEPPSKVMGDLPPIYASLDRIAVFLPIDGAKLHIDRAREYLGKDDKKRAAKELSLARGALVSIEVELPLFKVAKFISKARYDLIGRETGKADKALWMAEVQARGIYLMIESPLHLAKKKFWQASRAYSEGRTAEARTYLEQGRVYLEEEAKKGRASQRQAVSELSLEASDLEKRIPASGNVAATGLKSLWERSKALAERSAEYLAAGIAEEETTLKGEDNLIEAKLHVAYAETYQVTAGEPGKAADELGRADACLRKALQGELVDKANAEKINELDKEVLGIKADTAEKDSAVRDRYESIKGRLSELIHEL